MGDHLALFVDRLLADSTLEATKESRKCAESSHLSASPSVHAADLNREDEFGKLVECRICQEEDEISNMENPCSCNGSLKYAHRKCIQRWCNEKGDNMCEICLQQFKPGYSAPAPPPVFHYGTIPMDFRGSWEISSRDFHDTQIIMVPSDRDVMGPSDHDYNPSTTQSTICCRSIAIIFMTLLFLRHLLPLMLSEDEDYSLALFSLLVLRSAGILLPIAVIARALTIFQQRRHRRQVSRNIPISGSDEESARSPSILHQSQPHLIHAH